MNTDFRVLLDKSVAWDANKAKMLDELVKLFYANPGGVQVRLSINQASENEQGMQANQILSELKDDPDLWLAADTILEYGEDANTKYFALQALEQAIQVFPNMI